MARVGKIALLLLLLPAGGFGFAVVRHRESPEQIWRRLVDAVRGTPPPAPAAEPSPDPTPALAAIPSDDDDEATPTPAPASSTPGMAAAPVDPLAWLLAHKERWPKEVVLQEATTFPILIGNREAGSGAVPAGSTVRLLQVESETGNVTVAYAGYGNGSQRVPVQKTDLRRRAGAEMARAESEPPPPVPPDPAVASTPPPAAAETPRHEETPPPAPAVLPVAAARSEEKLSGAGVTVSETDKGIVLSNGILTATITKGAGISSLKYRGFEMANSIYYSMDGGPAYRTPGGGPHFFKTKTPDLVDVGFKNPRRNEPQAFDCEVHYVLKRGSSGIYTYAVLSHPADYPKTGVGEWRMVWKLSGDLLEKIFVDPLRRWQMPSSEDYKRAEPTGIKEIVKITTGVRAGQFDCKYDFSASYYDLGCWGHASDKNKVGAWIVLGGYDYFNDGPTKQDLNAAAGINHIHFGMNHYNGSGTSVEAGEEWQKIYGPFLLYCNSGDKGADALWADAKKQVETEKAAWPYVWLTDNPAYPPAKARGSLAGRLVVKDPLKPALNGGNAWVGLAQPAPGGNWQFESKKYQYWVKADAAGNFNLPGVRPGVYNLYAFTDGAVGECSRPNVEVKVGTNKLPGDLIWEVPRKGRSLAWEIGVPDRTAKEFRHGNDYFHGYVWTHFHEEFKNPLEFTVGKSDPAKDWNYAHSWYQVGDQRVPHQWRIHFNLPTVPPSGEATLTFAIAGAHGGARINVYVNAADKPFGTVTPSIQGGNALLRESIHAKYCVEHFTIPTSLLKPGANTITLEQGKTDTQSHVMYDYLSLEMP